MTCRLPLAVLAAAGVLSLAASAAAQEPLQRIKDLYTSAAYEDVLSAVLAVDGGGADPEVEQYRVFSLIALGRTAEAEKTVEAILKSDLRFHPDEGASPRILDLFAQTRRKLAPKALQSMYVDARSALDAKDRAAAIKGFEQLVAMASEPDLDGDTTVSELKLLASGFLDLSRALPADPVAPASETAPPAAATKASPPSVRPPVPISEVLPAWMPPDALARTEFRGSIRVKIDASGHVTSAELVTPIYPTYDAALLKASQAWTYQPGTENGTPVPSERVLQVLLKPR